MTPTQRKALEQALECLHDNRHHIITKERPAYLALYDKAIDDAEAALAEKQPLISAEASLKFRLDCTKDQLEAAELEISELRQKLRKEEQPAQQEPLLSETDLAIKAEALGIDPNTPGLYAFYVDCISSLPRPAQQQEPVAKVKENPYCPEGTSDELDKYLPVGTKLYTAPQPAKPAEHDWQAQAERSAQGWMDRALKAEKQFERARRWAIAAGVPPEKLDAAPEAPQPAKQPLTDEDLDSAVKAWFENDIVAGHRPFHKRMRAAIDAAHGGGQP